MMPLTRVLLTVEKLPPMKTCRFDTARARTAEETLSRTMSTRGGRNVGPGPEPRKPRCPHPAMASCRCGHGAPYAWQCGSSAVPPSHISTPTKARSRVPVRFILPSSTSTLMSRRPAPGEIVHSSCSSPTYLVPPTQGSQRTDLYLMPLRVYVYGVVTYAVTLRTLSAAPPGESTERKLRPRIVTCVAMKGLDSAGETLKISGLGHTLTEKYCGGDSSSPVSVAPIFTPQYPRPLYPGVTARRSVPTGSIDGWCSHMPGAELVHLT